MANILLGLASCHEAFLTAPAVRALLAAGHTVRLAYFGKESALDEVRSMGMPDGVAIDAFGKSSASVWIDATQFAADLFAADLARRRSEQDVSRSGMVLTIGSGPFATALAQQFAQPGSCSPITVALAAGVRPVVHASTNARLAVDHSVLYCCAPNESARANLLREGKAPDCAVVTGSLSGAALAALPAPASAGKPVDPFVWIALERDYGQGTIPDELSGLFDGLRAAGQATNLAPRMAPTKHLGSYLLLDQPKDAGWIWSGDDEPLAQLDATRTASLIITDSLGYQELAAAAGIPCVALGLGGSWRRDLVASGHVVVANSTRALAGCAETAMRSTRATSNDGPVDPGQALVDALRDFTLQRDPAAPEAGQGDALPTEGDASGRTFDHAEVDNVTTALRSGTLNSTRGTFVHRFEQEFAQWLGSSHAIACSNGSAAVHCAIAALGLSAGDEVITTPITDMGALTPIFYEGAVPVFADVDPVTLNVTAETIAAQLTERTKAIVVTHLFGNPCDLGPILSLACRHELPIIEDAAQAFGATFGGRDTANQRIGTQGLISAFSLQQGKHITTGEGGIVCTNDEQLARKLFLFVNKAWGYGDQNPDHYFPALNYRMTELQGAVACAQLPKLDGVVRARRRIAARLRVELGNLIGIHYPTDPVHGTHSYWKFAFRVDGEAVPGGAVALGGRMREQGIACAPRYVQKPAFECQLFREWRASPVSALPLAKNPRGSQDGPLFDRSDYPGATAGLEQVVVLPINENYTDADVAKVATAIRTAHQELTRG